MMRAGDSSSRFTRVMRWIANGVIVIWLILLAVVIASRSVNGAFWIADIIANVSYLVAAPALLSAIVLMILRKWKSSAVAVALGLILLLPIVRILTAAFTTGGSADRDQPAITILLANVNARTQPVEELAKIVERERPDLICIIECARVQARSVLDNPAIRERLPYEAVPEHGQMWNHIIVSRWPLEAQEFDGDFDRYKFLYAYRRSYLVDHPARDFVFTATHPASPRNASTWASGNRTIKLLGEVVNNHLKPLDLPLVIAGDFNTTATGHRYEMFRSMTRLQATDAQVGYHGTWPSDWPGWLRLPLDRAWGTRDVRFQSMRVVEDIGSDHRPVLMTFTIDVPARER